MMLHGYCLSCHKVKLVRVDRIRRGGVQLGICRDCEAKK
jgi:hypothetical protein